MNLSLVKTDLHIIKCSFVFTLKYVLLQCALCLPVDWSGAVGTSEDSSSVATFGSFSVIFLPTSVVSTGADSTPKAKGSEVT